MYRDGDTNMRWEGKFNSRTDAQRRPTSVLAEIDTGIGRLSHLMAFANRRLRRIESSLGRDVVEAAEVEAKAEFASGIDPRLWQVFVTGKQPARDEHGCPILPSEPDEVDGPSDQQPQSGAIQLPEAGHPSKVVQIRICCPPGQD
jgi:hypothetical protein